MVAQPIFFAVLHISINNLDNQKEASTATKANVSAAIILFTSWQIYFDCHIIRYNLPILSLKNIVKPPWEPPLSKLL